MNENESTRLRIKHMTYVDTVIRRADVMLKDNARGFISGG